MEENKKTVLGCEEQSTEISEHTDISETGSSNPDIVKAIAEKLPDEELLYDVAELFKVFGDSTRVRIICALFESEMCVCDIAGVLNMTQSAISHQLRVLKQARLVKYRREGKTVFYSLADGHIQTIFNQAFEHIME
ncbi:MAG: metalloregulator ArsR/SmtB family transcription factor [Oscillospiraceae bacterium]|nr:metalloregulator ArsR/SmtB family transcription factor [Oscillospiraceae bacterium]